MDIELLIGQLVGTEYLLLGMESDLGMWGYVYGRQDIYGSDEGAEEGALAVRWGLT